MGARAAKDAGQRTADATVRAAEINQEMYEQGRQDLAPYRGLGYGALNEIGGAMAGRQPVYDEKGNITGFQTGTGYLTGQLTPQKIQEYLDPSMAFRMKYGTQATERLQNVGQGALSGNTLRALNEYGQGFASTEFGNAFNRFQTQRSNIYNTLAGIAGIGQTSLGQTTTAGTQAASNIGTNIANAGAATAGGIVGSANAMGGGITGAGQNYMLSQILGNRSGGVNYGLNIGGGGSVGFTAHSIAAAGGIGEDDICNIAEFGANERDAVLRAAQLAGLAEQLGNANR
jgi:hypothetical protein